MDLILFAVAALLLVLFLGKGGAVTAQDPQVPEPVDSGIDDSTGSLPSLDVPAADPSNLSDAADNILQAMFQAEGGQAGNRNVRNNNPMDLEKSSLAVGNDGRFAIFADIGDGWQAAYNWLTSHVQKHPDWDFYDLYSYMLRGNTTGPFQDAQGDSDAYAEYVAGFAGFDPTQTVYSALYGQQGAS